MTNYFVVAQLKELLAAMAFSADKLRTLELVAPRLLDGQNSFVLDRVVHLWIRQGQCAKDLEHGGDAAAASAARADEWT